MTPSNSFSCQRVAPADTYTGMCRPVTFAAPGTAQQMAEAAEAGALDAAVQMGCGLKVISVRAAEASIDHLLDADGYIFCAPENLASR